jgi:sporulation protein YlmC with PRC-barrel domain
MAKQEKKAMTKDRLIGMQVIDGEGNNAGTVLDIAFTVGKVGMTMIVRNKKGETKEIPWESIQAAGDYVILKPPTGQPLSAQTGQPTTCPTCGGPLTYIEQYQRWYCYKDKKYV